MTKEITKSRFIKRMKGEDYIESTRLYLDYLQEHLDNVAKAFSELSEACDGKEYWVSDDSAWNTLRYDVVHHDISKFTKEEFTQYRDNFFAVNDLDKENSCFSAAWENHKKENSHHHETAENLNDLVHMIIDWVAMSYKFKDDARAFYEKSKPIMGKNITDDFHEFIARQFDHLESHREKDKND